MDLGTPHNIPEQPTRFEGVRLPVSRFELREISTVLFLHERDSLEKTLANILSAAAALCRAIEIERGSAPTRALWSEAEELAPGVFQLLQFPSDETDEVVRERLRHLYLRDARARYVPDPNGVQYTLLKYSVPDVLLYL
jgi:hypothetical protein